MADKTPPSEPTPPAPAATPPAGDEWQLLLDLGRRYGPPAAIGLILAVLVFFGVNGYRTYRQSARQQASLALVAARTAEDFQRVADQYGATSAAPVARLGEAGALFAEGRFERALAAYEAFERDHPKHPMTPALPVARALCLEALGRLPEAIEAFAAFAAARPDHFLGPAAALGRARCLEQLERWDEARAAYEDFIAGHPDSPWTVQAEMNLESVRRARAAAGG